MTKHDAREIESKLVGIHWLKICDIGLKCCNKELIFLEELH